MSNCHFGLDILINVKISAVIITFNEENNIAQAIKSVAWADEILVVDSESDDQTREIAESLGARVLTQKWLGFSKQKQFAIENASNSWIISIDADEAVSDQLREEILQLKISDTDTRFDGYKIPRLSFYMNRPIRHGGWYPDRQLRLFNKTQGKWKEVLIHESFILADSAGIGQLDGDIHHFSVENASHHHQMIGERYAPLAALQMFKDGKTTSRIRVATAGMTGFLRTYLFKAGILDGFAGFVISRFAAHHNFLKHLLLWELINEKTRNQKD
jgi:glycosyltransferase involved in cell wall biosynthesis